MLIQTAHHSGRAHSSPHADILLHNGPGMTSPATSCAGLFWLSSCGGILAYQLRKPIPTSAAIMHTRVYAQAWSSISCLLRMMSVNAQGLTLRITSLCDCRDHVVKSFVPDCLLSKWASCSTYYCAGGFLYGSQPSLLCLVLSAISSLQSQDMVHRRQLLLQH